MLRSIVETTVELISLGLFGGAVAVWSLGLSPLV
jgi:hypothetical protein